MPLLTLHLLSLFGSSSREDVLKQLLNERPSVETIVASLPRYWVIKPERNDTHTLVNTRWDLMLLLKTPDGQLPASVRSKTVREYVVCLGIPSKLLAGYEQKNRSLLEHAPSVPLTGSLDNFQPSTSSQNLELSPDLFNFMNDMVRDHDGPVTMLNLLHFKHDGKSEYYKYGQVSTIFLHGIQENSNINAVQGFIEAGGKRGGDAKIVGNVVPPPSGRSGSRGDPVREQSSWWNEAAIVHYPSIRHFCDMAAGEDYQAINRKYRLPVSDYPFSLPHTALSDDGIRLSRTRFCCVQRRSTCLRSGTKPGCKGRLVVWHLASV